MEQQPRGFMEKIAICRNLSETTGTSVARTLHPGYATPNKSPTP
jgi:hypothetical protein